MNPVFLLDEVDKVGADWRGDPSSALLEVLDPAQNHSFRDHYLEVELDLSDVLFIATANVVETIPGPLLDRMEVVRLDGYTEDEKLAIARDHLLERQLDQTGLRGDEVIVTEAALRTVVGDYTREAGVRNLEREIGKLLRKAATRIAGGEASTPLVVDDGDVRGYLGRQRFFFEAAERTAVPGVATGLAVTGTGGDVLFIEASVMDGEPGLTLTGQLGDVMKESASIALSYVRAHAGELGIERRRGRAPVPRPRPGGRRPQGRPIGRRDHDHRPGQPAHRPAGPGRGRHDRRGHPPGPGPAHRRGQAEGPGRPPGRPQGDHPPRAQRGRPRGRPRVGPGRDDLPPGQRDRPGPGPRPRPRG